MNPVYLDCNATTPIEPEVLETVRRYLAEEFGNPASTHCFGRRAQAAVQRAREEVAAVVAGEPDEVIFTSGATEANNLALLGLAPYGEETGRRHILASAVEHKAVLEPLEQLKRRGFEIELIPVDADGRVKVDLLQEALRPETLLVSVMHVNNETGIIQPLDRICATLEGHPAFLHSDAAQGFGKELALLTSPRLDLISISGHKVYGPKGIGALIARKRGGIALPLAPIMYGGGQEGGLRPGTLATPLIAGLGTAARLALANHAERTAACVAFRERALAALEPLRPYLNGNPQHSLPHAVNLALPKILAEEAVDALQHLVAVSTTSACNSSRTAPSHVLAAMGIPRPRAVASLRLAWCHLTPEPDWKGVAEVLKRLQK